jgi:hypothetical protein
MNRRLPEIINIETKTLAVTEYGVIELKHIYVIKRLTMICDVETFDKVLQITLNFPIIFKMMLLELKCYTSLYF